MNRLPVYDLVFYLHSRKVPRAEIDRITLVSLDHQNWCATLLS